MCSFTPYAVLEPIGRPSSVSEKILIDTQESQVDYMLHDGKQLKVPIGNIYTETREQAVHSCRTNSYAQAHVD